ncbi:MAG: hypothetical protein V3R52_08530, partial [Candidatus Neomarinimicrobiota bacterium]
QIITTSNGQIAVIQANALMKNYAKVEISFDIIEKEVIALDVSAHLNDEGNSDPDVESVVSYWREQTDKGLSDPDTLIDFVNMHQ